MTDEIERKWLDEAARFAGWEDWGIARSSAPFSTLASISAHACTLRDFDAFRREVSERITTYVHNWRNGTPSRGAFRSHFADLILPAPDPLAEQLGPELAAQVREKVPGAVKVEVGDA